MSKLFGRSSLSDPVFSPFLATGIGVSIEPGGADTLSRS
jgi:hypothetical protein